MEESKQDAVAVQPDLSAVPYRWITAMRSLFRILLTAGLFTMVWLFFRDLSEGIDYEVSSKEVWELIAHIVKAVVFMATTAGTWWFADRAMSAPVKK